VRDRRRHCRRRRLPAQLRRADRGRARGRRPLGKGAGAGRVVAAVPLAAAPGLEQVRAEADEVVCPYTPAALFAVGSWYGSFDQLGDGDVLGLLDENRRSKTAAPGA